LADSSHGSARLPDVPGTPRDRCANRDQLLSRPRCGLGTDAVSTARSHAERAEKASRWRGWIERAGCAAPRLAMWTSRDTWLSGLGRWAQSHALAALCTAERVSITATTLLAIAAVMAEHADHDSGRHVAITRATIAARVGCTDRTVTAAWRLLRASGWAVEAQRGHGSPTTPGIGRRPSVYHLVSRREPTSPPPVHNSPDFHLPPSRRDERLTPVGNNSPRARTRAKNSTPPTKNRRWRAEPRPLPVQRLAAELANRCHGLHRGHIGALCDALTRSGIDPDLWTARQIIDTLNTDMRQSGWAWPNRIEKPGAFLASRLRRHAQTFAGPPPRLAATAPPVTPAPTPAPVHSQPQQVRITRARADIQAILDAAAQRRQALTVIS
jgi:hypothetical protein